MKHRKCQIRTRKGQLSSHSEVGFKPYECLRCVAMKMAFWYFSMRNLSTLSSDSSCQLDVLWHNGDPLGVDGAQIGVFEKTNQVSFWGFLQSCDSSRLESQVSFEVLSDFSDQSLERQFSDEQFSWFLVSSDLSESNGTRSVTMRFLDSTSSWCALSCSFGGQLLSWSLASSRFSGGLLGSCHLELNFEEIRKNSSS